MNNFDGVNFAQFRMPIITIYKGASDFEAPDEFVARIFDIDKPTPYFVSGASLEEVRNLLPQWMNRLMRHPTDEPHILEVWI